MQLLGELIGEAAGLVAVRRQAEILLKHHGTNQRPATVLIQGETGTGKGVLARALHRAGSRAAAPFVEINCAAIPETLLEAELFGFERGAFTDARQAKQGLFQAAHRGTLFLDEVGLLPAALQAKLLTAIENRTVRRLGATRNEPVDVWIVAATSTDLQAAVDNGDFRRELYHRLAVVTLTLPPLRERGTDVLLLAEHFLERACAEYGLPPKAFAADARAAALAYFWPGNVRELSNAVERAALLSELPVVSSAMLAIPAPAGGARAPDDDPRARREALGTPKPIETRDLLRALDETGWNVTRAASRLGLSRNAMRYRMAREGLRPRSHGGEPAPETMQADLFPPPQQAQPTAGSSAGGNGPVKLRWEGRHVAFLGATVVGQPGSAPQANQALEMILEKVQGFGGRLEDLSPIGLTAAFGLEALEDAPRRAAHAALAISKACARGDTPACRVGIGLHVVHLLAARAGGRTEADEESKRQAKVQLGALIQRAGAGAVLVSQAAAPFLERRFVLAATGTGEARLVGHERTGLGLGGRLTGFVGRQLELSFLEERWQRALSGASCAVDVAGEAGIGKSRLLHELRRRHAEDDLAFFSGHCTADGGSTAFLPFIEVVRSLFGIAEEDSPQEAGRKLRSGVERVGVGVDATVPLLSILLSLPATDELRGLDAEIVGARTRDALAGLLRARCRLSPVVLLVDDLHWADTASQDLLSRLVGGGGQERLLIVCAYRPPYRPPWSGHPSVAELRLEALPDDCCAELIQHRLGAAALPETTRLVLEKAGGNPLFAEEIVRYLVESGALVGTDRGLQIRNPHTAAIPGTLQHLLLSRVASLEERSRTVLETAAVIGPRFSSELVGSSSGLEDSIADRLPALAEQGMIEQGDGEDGGEFRFRHVLLREAIYESIPEPRRQALHQRVAERLEQLHRDRLTELAEVLAYHYGRTTRTAEAVRYLGLAGEKCLRVYSLEEADRYFDQVIAAVERSAGAVGDAHLADALLGKAHVCFYRSDFKQLIVLVERYQRRIEALGDPRRHSMLLFWLGFSLCCAARNDAAKSVLSRALALGELAGDDRCIGYAVMGLMYAGWITREGRPHDAVDKLGERALAIADRLNDAYLASHCLHILALDRLNAGRYAEARDLGSRLLEMGRKTGADRIMAMSLHVRAFASLFDEEYEEAIGFADQACRLAPSPVDKLMARAAGAAAVAMTGRGTEALEILEEIRREAVAGEYFALLLPIDIPYGAALVMAGRMARGVRWIEGAIERFATWRNEHTQAFANLVLGEIYLQMIARQDKLPARMLLRNLGFILRSAPFAARRSRRHFDEAIRIARRADIPGLLARSLLDEFSLLNRTGRSAEAMACLEEARRVAGPLGSRALNTRIERASKNLRVS